MRKQTKESSWGYSLTLKAYTVLNTELKQIKETDYVMFDDNYLKKYQKVDSLSVQIFLMTNPMNYSFKYLKGIHEPV